MKTEFLAEEILKQMPVNFRAPTHFDYGAEAAINFRITPSDIYGTPGAMCEYPSKPISKMINYANESV